MVLLLIVFSKEADRESQQRQREEELRRAAGHSSNMYSKQQCLMCTDMQCSSANFFTMACGLEIATTRVYGAGSLYVHITNQQRMPSLVCRCTCIYYKSAKNALVGIR